MSEAQIDHNLGLFLKGLLKERSMSIRELSRLAEIDPATISRIINGKRKANAEHLQKFADCLGVPIAKFFAAAGFTIEQNQVPQPSDIHLTVDQIQTVIESSNLYAEEFSIANVEQKLANYQKYGQTQEGKEFIINSFEDKLKKIGGIGPFISQLKDMYEKFRFKKGTPVELAIIGSALIYFIVPIDVIPDYIFPVGYIDDAIAVQIAVSLLARK